MQWSGDVECIIALYFIYLCVFVRLHNPACNKHCTFYNYVKNISDRLTVSTQCIIQLYIVYCIIHNSSHSSLGNLLVHNKYYTTYHV